jgi:hypothetical protein
LAYWLICPGTPAFGIVSIVRDAKFAGSTRQAGPADARAAGACVSWDGVQRLELASHFIGALMLVTEQPSADRARPSAHSPGRSGLMIITVRTMERQAARVQSAARRGDLSAVRLGHCCSPRSGCTA